MRKFPLMLFITLSCPASAEPIDSSDIRVIDGDTIRVHHKQPNVRLVGFNAPETAFPVSLFSIIASVLAAVGG